MVLISNNMIVGRNFIEDFEVWIIEYKFKVMLVEFKVFFIFNC